MDGKQRAIAKDFRNKDLYTMLQFGIGLLRQLNVVGSWRGLRDEGRLRSNIALDSRSKRTGNLSKSAKEPRICLEENQLTAHDWTVLEHLATPTKMPSRLWKAMVSSASATVDGELLRECVGSHTRI